MLTNSDDAAMKGFRQIEEVAEPWAQKTVKKAEETAVKADEAGEEIVTKAVIGKGKKSTREEKEVVLSFIINFFCIFFSFALLNVSIKISNSSSTPSVLSFMKTILRVRRISLRSRRSENF